MIKRSQLIDDETGLIVSTNDFKYTIFDNDKGYLFGTKKAYIKSYQGIKLSSVISNKADYANMHLLGENLYKDTSMIAVKRNRKVYPAEVKEMSQIIGLNERYTKEFVQRMMELGVIAKLVINTKETIQVQYHANPLYFTSSKYISPALYMMFRKQLDEHLPAWAIQRFNEK